MSVPVIYPAEIFPTFVPAHVDPERDLMVGEHYLFIKLRDSTWLFQKELEREPAVDGKSSQEELDALRSRVNNVPWTRALLPYRQESKP